MEFSIDKLENWNQKIENMIQKEGLDYYPQEFEICSFKDMISYEAYSGMPARYPHWSFGKAFEKIQTFYRYNLTGLPYEMVINSNPCLAYLMKENSLLLQILTMAHVYGHNDFFKNNRLFRQGTKAHYTLEMFKSHSRRIRKYCTDPEIGYEQVEKILDIAHALRFQTSRVIGEKKLTRKEKIKRIKEQYQPKIKEFHLLEKYVEKELPDLDKIPLEPEEDILSFFINYTDLEEWEKDIIQIVIDETQYFIPQIETKIMNEGWASYWHYQILKDLNLPQAMYLEFIKRHNQVIRPFIGGLNPYYIGFKIFENINNRFTDNPDKIFEVRTLERDESFIRKYLTFDLIKEMNLLEYQEKNDYLLISEIADKSGWKKIRNTLATSVGLNKVPVIKIITTTKSNHILHLQHEHQEDDLEINYASETLKYISELWGGRVILKTKISDKPKKIICTENKKVKII